ncbi:MAG TPA: ThuA domain-containing protein [Thermomicrobiales bacterium]|nr:ThuA domain-containing protein [Thermomicrobiales bacterium]
MTIRVTVWNEFRHEKENPKVSAVYPDGIHAQIKTLLGREADFAITTATLDEPEHGLPQQVLDGTDVLVWWGHKAHADVSDAVVERVRERVWAGMGLIVLHSGHYSKIFKTLMGTSCSLKWREADDNERIWIVNPGHAIASGLPEYIDIEREEMYGELFDIPAPDELIMISWFKGGEVFRSGCTYTRGLGKIFYFRPGHETYPTYHNPVIGKVLANSIRWAAPNQGPVPTFHNYQPLEK